MAAPPVSPMCFQNNFENRISDDDDDDCDQNGDYKPNEEEIEVDNENATTGLNWHLFSSACVDSRQTSFEMTVELLPQDANDLSDQSIQDIDVVGIPPIGYKSGKTNTSSFPMNFKESYASPLINWQTEQLKQENKNFMSAVSNNVDLNHTWTGHFQAESINQYGNKDTRAKVIQNQHVGPDSDSLPSKPKRSNKSENVQDQTKIRGEEFTVAPASSEWVLTEDDLKGLSTYTGRPANVNRNKRRAPMRNTVPADASELPLPPIPDTFKIRPKSKHKMTFIMPLSHVAKVANSDEQDDDVIVAHLTSAGITEYVPCMQCHGSNGYSTAPEQTFQTNGRCQQCGGALTSALDAVKALRRLKTMFQDDNLIVQDVRNDGNCLFAAVVDQLRTQGNFEHDIFSLRKASVEYLRHHPYADDGSRLDAFLAGETWDQYLWKMEGDGVWGDHMILNAIAEVLRMNIVIYGGIADQRKTTIVPKSCSNQAIRGDVRIGHLIESHYISLRKKDWMEILDTQHGNDHIHGLETSDNANFPLNHLDMIMKLVIQCEYVQSLTPNQARQFKPPSARGKEETVQIVGDFLSEAIPMPYSGPTLESVPLSNAFSHESNVTLIPIFYSPHDTRARFENDQAATKDVVISGNPSEGAIKLIPVKPSLWKGLVHNSNDISYLKTFELSVDLIPVILKETLLYVSKTIGLDVKCIISFWCEWPISALEWVSRNRPGMFPAYNLVHSLFNGGCDVVPCFGQTEYGDVIDDCANVSDANTPIHWCLSFAVPERSLFKNLSMQQRSCFLIYRAMVEQSIAGHVLPSSIVKSLFLYACENIPQNDWERKPGHCLLLLLRNTFNAFSGRFLAHYFICSKNLLRCLSESVLQECASELQKCWSHPIAALNYALETLNVASSEIGPVLDQIIADMNEFVVDGNAKKSFVNCLYPSSGYIMQSMILNGEYEKALTTLQDIQTQFETVFSKQINVEQIILSVLSRTNMCCQWTFALFMDIRLGTQISAAICQGLQKIHISEVFGPKAMEHLADTVMPESASIEHGDLTYAGTVMEILRKLKKDDAMIVVIKYYLETYSRLAGDSLVIPVRDEGARNGIICANLGMVKLVGSKLAVTEYELSTALPLYLNYLNASLFNTCQSLGKIEEYRSVFPAYRALATLGMSETFTRNVRYMESCLEGGGSSSERMLKGLMISLHPNSIQDSHSDLDDVDDHFL